MTAERFDGEINFADDSFTQNGTVRHKELVER